MVEAQKVDNELKFIWFIREMFSEECKHKNNYPGW